MKFHAVDQMMRRAVSRGVFPGAVLLISANRSILFHQCYGEADMFSRRPVTLDTVFDLASLTKPLATALAVMKLVACNQLSLDRPLGSVLPAFNRTDRSGITVRHLLDHTSGLPDYRPYYKKLSKLPFRRSRAVLTDLLGREPLAYPVGGKTLYSDLGFMALARMVEKISGDRLDRFVAREIYRPLGLTDLFFVDLDAPRPHKAFAATEKCPWRGKLLCGEVHDDNAWSVGGIDGHAGLFGTAAGLHQLLSELLAAYHGESDNRVLPGELVRVFLSAAPGRERTPGFDTPSAVDSSSGRYFSRNSVGHLGFTGPSFWMDLDQNVMIILLTNRVHPSRENTGIKDFRPKLHDRVMESMGCVRHSR